MYNDSFKVRYKTVPIAIHEKKTTYPTRPHNHNEIEMLLICQGRSEIRVNSECIQVEKGDLVFVNPLEVHAVFPDRNMVYSHRCICFDGALVGNDTVRQGIEDGVTGLPRHISRQDPHNRFLVQKFDQLFDAVLQDRDTLAMEIPAYAALLMVYLMNHGLLCENSGKNADALFCGRVHRFIAENYQQNITSREAAEELSFNQSYFCRTFRKHFGMTFSEYLNFYRVSASKKLIEKGNRNIADIAALCGFANPEYYSRSFKKYIGVVPREYKKSM